MAKQYFLRRMEPDSGPSIWQVWYTIPEEGEAIYFVEETIDIDYATKRAEELNAAEGD